jgi:hypothetical protein
VAVQRTQEKAPVAHAAPQAKSAPQQKPAFAAPVLFSLSAPRSSPDDGPPKQLDWNLGKIPIQCKLSIGAVTDPLEQEADRVADQVMGLPDSAVPLGAAEQQPIKARPAASGPQLVSRSTNRIDAQRSRAVPHQVANVVGSAGKPLDRETRSFFEPRFGFDFSHVRVHADAEAAASARAIGALAYTAGSQLAFAAGQYQPDSFEGRRLLAHELAHVVQQDGGAAGGAPFQPPHASWGSESQPIERPSFPSIQRSSSPSVIRRNPGDPPDPPSPRAAPAGLLGDAYRALAADSDGRLYDETDMTYVKIGEHTNLEGVKTALGKVGTTLEPSTSVGSAETVFIRVTGPGKLYFERTVVSYNPTAPLQAMKHELNHIRDYRAGKMRPNFTIKADNLKQFLDYQKMSPQGLLGSARALPRPIASPLEVGKRLADRYVAEIRTNLRDMEELPSKRGAGFLEVSASNVDKYRAKLASLVETGNGGTMNAAEVEELKVHINDYIDTHFPEMKQAYKNRGRHPDPWKFLDPGAEPDSGGGGKGPSGGGQGPSGGGEGPSGGSGSPPPAGGGEEPGPPEGGLKRGAAADVAAEPEPGRPRPRVVGEPVPPGEEIPEGRPARRSSSAARLGPAEPHGLSLKAQVGIGLGTMAFSAARIALFSSAMNDALAKTPSLAKETISAEGLLAGLHGKKDFSSDQKSQGKQIIGALPYEENLFAINLLSSDIRAYADHGYEDDRPSLYGTGSFFIRLIKLNTIRDDAARMDALNQLRIDLVNDIGELNGATDNVVTALQLEPEFAKRIAAGNKMKNWVENPLIAEHLWLEVGLSAEAWSAVVSNLANYVVNHEIAIDSLKSLKGKIAKDIQFDEAMLNTLNKAAEHKGYVGERPRAPAPSPAASQNREDQAGPDASLAPGPDSGLEDRGVRPVYDHSKLIKRTQAAVMNAEQIRSGGPVSDATRSASTREMWKLIQSIEYYQQSALMSESDADLLRQMKGQLLKQIAADTNARSRGAF